MSKQLIKYLFVGIVLGLVLVAYAKAAAVKVEDFYKGATLTFIVPYGPGGGVDLTSRALAPRIEKYTGATVVIKNIEGAGGLVGGGYLYTTAKPDGLTIMNCMGGGMTLAELLGSEAVKFEMLKFGYIGRLEVVPYALCASPASGFKTIEDMKKSPKPIRIGVVDPTSEISIYSNAIAEAFGLKAKMIPGFKGTKEVELALIAGRMVDAMVVTTYTGQLASIKEGDMVPIAATTRTRLPVLPHLPILLETPGLTPEGKKWLDFTATMAEVGRTILAPPGTPEDKRLFLEKALLASLKEPEFIEWLQKRGQAVNPLGGKELKALITSIMKETVPPAERPKFKHIFLEKYY